MGVFHDLANGLRDGFLTNDQLNRRKEATNFCSTAKAACIAAAVIVATSAVFSILSATFMGVVFGMVLGAGAMIASHDAYQLFSNVQKIFDSVFTEVSVNLQKEAMKAHLSEGMILGRPIVDQWIDSLQQKKH